MRFFIIAGERSGDHYAASLVSSILKFEPNSEFYGFGGDEMESSGVTLFRRIPALELIGFTEVLSKFSTVLANFRIAKQKINELNPQILLLIDYPGFNLRMAKWAKRKGMTVFYYIAPQTWAWKRKRNRILAKYVDHLFYIFPFEGKMLKADGVSCSYVGHPMADDVNLFIQESHTHSAMKKNAAKTIAVLPGSRKSEVEKFNTLLNKVIQGMPEYHFIVAGLRSLPSNSYKELKLNPNVSLVMDDPMNVLRSSNLGLIKSGTSTLQAALLHLPQVVFYSVSPISAWLMKRLLTIRFVSLPNLILNKEVVKEYLQEELTVENLINGLKKLEAEPTRLKILEEYDRIDEIMTKSNSTADLVAQKIIEHLEE